MSGLSGLEEIIAPSKTLMKKMKMKHELTHVFLVIIICKRFI